MSVKGYQNTIEVIKGLSKEFTDNLRVFKNTETEKLKNKFIS